MKISCKWILAVAAVAAIVCFNVPASQAGMYGNARWCAVTNDGGDSMSWDCEYDTQEDCAPAVLQANRGFCSQNPYWRDSLDVR